MGQMNERYVCWKCEETRLKMGREILNDDPAPECPSCEEKMEMFDCESLRSPDKPSFDSEENS
jgi:transcription initiation factor IIE alpha subunit